MTSKYFDIDLARGNFGENLLTEILQMSGDQLEIKTDYQWQHTGNLYIEKECYYNNLGRFDGSGITTTTSQWWVSVCVVDGKMPSISINPVSLIRRAIEQNDCPIVSMNEGANPSKGYLVKLSQIYGHMLNASA